MDIKFPLDAERWKASINPEINADPRNVQQQPLLNSKKIWGCLESLGNEDHVFEFKRLIPSFFFGVADETPTRRNYYRLPGCIFDEHFVVTWNLEEDETSSATIYNLSSVNMAINDNELGPSQQSCLFDGDEVKLCVGEDEFSYMYFHTAWSKPLEGVHTKYLLERELEGEGSFGTVTMATRRSDGLTVAVKRIRSITGRSCEISMLFALEHPNICKALDVFYQEHPDAINLVLEFASEKTLLYHMKESKSLSEKQARAVMAQICSAMAYIHSKGIIHRDLKPDNTLVTRKVPFTIVVADFGSAVKSVNGFVRGIAGTLEYVAPEIADFNYYNHLVDSWAGGAILFEMLTGYPLVKPNLNFDHDLSFMAQIKERQFNFSRLGGVVKRRHWNGDAVTVDEVVRISRRAQSMISALLQRDPSERTSLTDACNNPWLIPLGHSPRF